MKQAEQYGQYELRRRIARGDVSEVFLARLPEGSGAQGLAVVRRVLRERSQNQEFVQQFLREAELSARLDHPNLVQIDDVGELDGSYFVATEYLPGGNVRELIERRGKALPAEAAIFITAEVCAGLQFAHALASPDGSSLGAVHGDLSPRNVVVTMDGVVKVVDFGLAKAWVRLGAAPPSNTPGVYAHLAPELARQESVDRRTDVYGCGALLYFMVTGQSPFPDATDPATAAARTAPPIPPSSHVRGLPKELEEIILRAMALEPKDRFPTCGAMRRQLDEAADALWLQCTSESVATVAREAFPEALASEDEILFLPDVPSEGEAAPEPTSPPAVAPVAAAPETTPASPATQATQAPQLPPPVEEPPPRAETKRATEPQPAAPVSRADDGEALPPPAVDTAAERPRGRLGLLIGGLVAALVVAFAALGVAAWALWGRPQQEVGFDDVMAAQSASLPPTGQWPSGAPPTAGQPGSPVASEGEGPKPPSAPAPPGADGQDAAPTQIPDGGSGATPPPSTAGYPVPSKAPPPSSGEGSSRERDRGERPNGGSPRSATPAGPTTGFLTVLTRPYSRVYMNSRLLGATPLLRREVPAGRHRLRLVNPDFPSKAVQVTIRPGQVTQVRETLGAP